MAAAEDIDIFCRAVKARSREHHEAIHVALERGWWAITGSVLRMEIDSLIRVIYLLKEHNERSRILESWVTGERIRDNQGKIVTDSKMVDVAKDCNSWVRPVYDFGNMFVHLTQAHDYEEVDPFQTYKHRDEVVEYLNKYHRGKVPGRSLDDSSTLGDIAAYAPHVLEKIKLNLDGYIQALCADGGRDACPPPARSTPSQN